MSKPMGMTPTFQIVHPSKAEDVVWDAVETAKAEGRDLNWTLCEVRTAWVECAEEEVRNARRDVERSLREARSE